MSSVITLWAVRISVISHCPNSHYIQLWLQLTFTLCCRLTAENDGYHVIPVFCGHGIGSYFHGPPDIIHVGMHLVSTVVGMPLLSSRWGSRHCFRVVRLSVCTCISWPALVAAVKLNTVLCKLHVFHLLYYYVFSRDFSSARARACGQ